jgi:hypothetical protein
MNFEPQQKILSAYSKGEIGWRIAVDKLGLENFAQLQALMDKNNLPLYEPAIELQKESINTLQQALVNTIKQDLDNES